MSAQCGNVCAMETTTTATATTTSCYACAWDLRSHQHTCQPATTEPDATAELTVYVSAYGGWDYTKTRGAMTRVTFAGANADATAADYISRKGHLVIQADEDSATDWDAFPLALAALHPTCEHGMSAQLCMGPDHFPSAAQERAMGW